MFKEIKAITITGGDIGGNTRYPYCKVSLASFTNNIDLVVHINNDWYQAI